jgi:3-methylcrotonyl-CoA carboxylase alpha subunit
MGDKAAAKRLMAEAGVPVVPGYDGEDQGAELLQQEAERIGYPLLIKASAGGGGRGLREVREPEQFQEQLESAKREALAAFGDDRVLLERLLEGARHVEVQVFGDQQGHVVHLGERDCSVQRRHQKVIEEAPSPAVDDELRARMGEAAVRAAQRVGYTNAGTVEFLLAPDGEFYFLEMNTRLQVEHPVTEMVTGLDLVKLQLEVAAGQPLPFDQAGVTIQGHAIEVRLYAEDPFNGFLPSSGALQGFRVPSSTSRDENVRTDAGYFEGATVSPFYDSLLAKIIVARKRRAAAIGTMEHALAETSVQGVATNLPLLHEVIVSKPFKAGAATVQFLEQFWQGETGEETIPTEIVLGAAGYYLAGMAESPGDPWSVGSFWRTAEAPRRLSLDVAGRRFDLSASPLGNSGDWEITSDSGLCGVSFDRLPRGRLLMRSGSSVSVFEVAAHPGLSISAAGDDHGFSFGLARPPAPDAVAHHAGAAGESAGQLTAPMPGVIVKLNVAVGDHVRERQTLAVLEAMKMEHAVQASVDGTVKAVHVAEGERVTGGAVLIELEAE